MTCLAALSGLCISDRAFAFLYGIQFLTSWGAFLFLILYHWKRTVFVIRSERSCFLSSALITLTAFLLYTFATARIPGHISNFGIYLPLCLFCMSIHGIVHKARRTFPLSSFFTRKQSIFILCAALLVPGLMTALTGGGYAELLLMINALAALLYLCNILTGWNLEKGRIHPNRENDYYAALQQMHREELLKKKFADFLHDDILQDLLSVKNMMTKAGQSDIRDMITETLDSLNTRIRGHMQDYHPVILKNLTLKENYACLITMISQSFPERPIAVSFDCAATLFLVEPYDVLMYRLIKELLTNIYKHTDGSLAQITLSQTNGMIFLEVSDNGTADADCLISADKTLHKGIASIMEQLHRIEGTIEISNSEPHGIRIDIQIPMKGDVSYQYFISR
ncbi:MAG: ATP-binding protein [Lachnospiraceae bacterium]|nr:ATP-binding protein [Lachnospiraceae bacterium]